MNFDNVKVEIIWSGDNIGCTMTDGSTNIEWGSLSRNDQLKILNGLGSMYDLFYRFLKSE